MVHYLKFRFSSDITIFDSIILHSQSIRAVLVIIMSERHYFCPLCINPNVFKNYSSLFKHIRQEHYKDPSFGIRCELSVFCGFRYSTFNSYRQHIYRCHRSLIDSSDIDNDVISSNIDDITDGIDDFSSIRTTIEQTIYIYIDPHQSSHIYQ